MPWVAAERMVLGIACRHVLPGDVLPRWAQTGGMIRTLRSLRGEKCVIWQGNDPEAPGGPPAGDPPDNAANTCCPGGETAPPAAGPAPPETSPGAPQQADTVAEYQADHGARKAWADFFRRKEDR